MMSTALNSMISVLCLAGSFATASPINVGVFFYSGYSAVKAFRNLAASCESVLNHYIPDTTIPLTPLQSMARSFNSMAHASAASALNYMSVYHLEPTFFENAPRKAAWDVFVALCNVISSRACGDSGDNDKKPPKNGPKP